MLRQFILAGAAGFLLAACEHFGKTDGGDKDGDRPAISVSAAVKISQNDAGDYSFSYDAPFFDEVGNFDFSKKGAVFNTVNLTFKIADGSVEGIRFKADPTDAIWIVEKVNVDEATGSPRGPYRGQQFSDFAVSEDGQTLTLVDTNNDGVLYRYGLRFDLNGETVIDDPDGQNGHG